MTEAVVVDADAKTTTITDVALWADSETTTAVPFSGLSSFCVCAETATGDVQTGEAATIAAGLSLYYFFCAAEITETTADAAADANQIPKRQRLIPLPFLLFALYTFFFFFLFSPHTFQIYFIEGISFHNNIFPFDQLFLFIHYFPLSSVCFKVFPIYYVKNLSVVIS